MLGLASGPQLQYGRRVKELTIGEKDEKGRSRLDWKFPLACFTVESIHLRLLKSVVMEYNGDHDGAGTVVSSHGPRLMTG